MHTLEKLSIWHSSSAHRIREADASSPGREEVGIWGTIFHGPHRKRKQSHAWQHNVICLASSHSNTFHLLVHLMRGICFIKIYKHVKLIGHGHFDLELFSLFAALLPT